MGKKQLVRELKAAALARMEDSARSVEDFQAVVKQWDHLDENRERKEGNPLRCCKHCQKAFMAGHPNAAFCSPRCKNQYNVYKSRWKKE